MYMYISIRTDLHVRMRIYMYTYRELNFDIITYLCMVQINALGLPGIHMHLSILTFCQHVQLYVSSYCRNTSMRLFVIGHFSKGKSTLIAALRKTRQTSIFDERSRRLLDPDYHLTEDGKYPCMCDVL